MLESLAIAGAIIGAAFVGHVLRREPIDADRIIRGSLSTWLGRCGARVARFDHIGTPPAIGERVQFDGSRYNAPSFRGRVQDVRTDGSGYISEVVVVRRSWASLLPRKIRAAVWAG